jgi:hypothetical protein
VWEILRAAGVDPARQRAKLTWASFIRSQADGEFVIRRTLNSLWVQDDHLTSRITPADDLTSYGADKVSNNVCCAPRKIVSSDGEVLNSLKTVW